MSRNPILFMLPLVSLMLATSGCARQKEASTTSGMTDAEVENLVRRSYQYVAMYNVNNKFATKQGGWNTVEADTQLKDHTMREIARPNNDTLYIGCMLDLRNDAVILEMPAFDSDYVSLMVTAYDHYVNVPMSTRLGDFGKPEKMLFYTARTRGYHGEPVEGVDRLFEASGDFVSAIFRVMPHAHEPARFQRIVDQMQSVKLITLSVFRGGEAKPIDDVRFPPVGKTDFDVFENNLLEVMQFVFNHTTFDAGNEIDQGVLAAYKPLGVEPGRPYDPGAVKAIDGKQFRRVAEQVAKKNLAIMGQPEEVAKLNPFWMEPKGKTTLDALVAASVIGPIGLPSVEAEYPPITTTGGETMNATNDYVIRMTKEQLPPARAFWSVTLYDLKNGFFIPNDRKKYSVGENGGMKLNRDGGIEIYIAAKKPNGVPEENWLPISRKDEDLSVNMRIYVPDLERFKTWTPPRAEKVGDREGKSLRRQNGVLRERPSAPRRTPIESIDDTPTTVDQEIAPQRLWQTRPIPPGRQGRMTKGATTVTRALTPLALAMGALLSAGLAGAQPSAPPTAECCKHSDLAEQYGIIWTGHDTKMPIERLAAYAAPVVWFSPDEPLLRIGQTGGRRARGKDILIPEPFPFEDNPGKPIVYYRVRRILQRLDEPGEGTYVEDPQDRGRSVIDLKKVAGVDLDFFFYYSMDIGGGSHEHDVEYIETRLAVGREPGCGECPYVMGLMRVTGKAHGIQWYDNTLEVDASAHLPIHVLVEEGKHASCPDRNADGYYTPGYDVTERVNDAWGVRDTLGTGTFFTGNYQSWMTKVRADDTRVFPPLPPDSPLREAHTRDGVYAPDNAIYDLRPYPRPDAAAPDLKPFIADKGDPDWPEVEKDTDLQRFGNWLEDESWVKSWAVSYRNDGKAGLSLAFPLLIFKNVHDPLGGGWFVNRIYFEGKDLRDFGWMLHYTQSASRWVDGYVSAGWERDIVDTDMGSTQVRNLFVAETGIKLRVNIHHTPAKFLAKLGTDFWGLRVGIRTVGLWDFEQIGYVFEFGAGSW